VQFNKIFQNPNDGIEILRHEISTIHDKDVAKASISMMFDVVKLEQFQMILEQMGMLDSITLIVQDNV
jgi:hypothetical protein